MIQQPAMEGQEQEEQQQQQQEEEEGKEEGKGREVENASSVWVPRGPRRECA